MPSKSKAQHNFMAAIAHSPSFAKKAGVPMSVGKDFVNADKGKKFSKGGTMATKDSGFDDDVKRVKSGLYMNKDEDRVYSRERGLGPGMAAKRLEERGVDIKGLAGNRANEEDLGSYKKGGMTKSDMKEDMKMDLKQDKSMMQKAVNKHEGRLHKGSPMTKLAKGGTASARGDGIAQRGKTKGMQVKMRGGGAC
jgi:hypothetical protein